MASKQKKQQASVPQNTSNKPILLARVLLLAAAGIASYLAWTSFSGGGVAGCGPSSDCDRVLQSRWAYWLGLPVSAPAALLYLSLLGITFQLKPGAAEERRQKSWLIASFLSVLIIGAACWFIGLQLLVLKAFCKFCTAAHLCGSVASALLLSQVPLVNAQKSRPASGLSRQHFWKAGLAALLGCAVLISGQLAVTKKGYQVSALASSEGSQAPAPTPQRILSLHNGSIQVDVNDLPILGSPASSNVVVSLFDYTCHYCRDLHKLLLTAQQKFSNQLAIVSLPMPLDKDCNPWITRQSSTHENACELASLGLAVWRAKRDAFSTFDNWLFGPASPPSIPEARKYAESLVGAEALSRALADPWVTNQIRLSVNLYVANYKETKSGKMPQLVAGKSIVTGPMRDISDLYLVLDQQFGLK